MKTIKAFKLTSPFKETKKDGSETNTGKKAAQKQEVSKSGWTGVSTSSAAGSKINQTEAATVTVPGKKSTANVDALKKGAKNLGPNYKPTAAETARANKRLAEARAKDAAASTPETVVKKPADTGADTNDGNNTNTFETNKTKVIGMTAMDARRDARRDIVLARQAGKLARKQARYEGKSRAEQKAVRDKARAEGFKKASENVAERQMYAKQQAQQGSWGNLESSSTKRQTLGEQEFASEGKVEGATSTKKSTSGNNGFNPGNTSVPTDSGLIKSTPDTSKAVLQKPADTPALPTTEEDKTKSPAAMKSAPFKMKGFGSKSGLYKK